MLIHSQKGALYLNDFGQQAFIELGRFLIAYEEMEDQISKGTDAFAANSKALFVDIKRPDGTSQEIKVASGIAGSRNYGARVKSFMGQVGYEFRVRSGALDSPTPFNVFQSSDLKIIRPNVGYFFASAGWNGSEAPDYEMNSAAFEQGLNFLFGSPTCEGSIPDQLIAQIPGHGSYLIKPNCGKVPSLRPQIQAIFGIVTDLASEEGDNQQPASVSVDKLVEEIESDDISNQERAEPPDRRNQDEEKGRDLYKRKTPDSVELDRDQELERSSQERSEDQRSNKQQQDLKQKTFTCPFENCSTELRLDYGNVPFEVCRKPFMHL